MYQVLAIIAAITQLLPLVLQTVKTVEGMFPDSGQGAAKMTIVQDVVQHALEATTGLDVTAQQIVPVLTPIVNNVVTILNATGAFKRSADAVVAPMASVAQ